MEKSKALGSRTFLTVAALLALLIAIVYITPRSARDFASVLAAMASIGVVLFVWSRLNTYARQAHAGQEPNVPDQAAPAAGVDAGAATGDNLNALLSIASEVSGAPLVGVLVLDRESGDLQSKASLVLRGNGGLRPMDLTLRVSRSEAGDLFDSMTSSPPRIGRSEPIESMLTDPCVRQKQIWSIPMVRFGEPQGVLIVGTDAKGLSKASIAHLQTVADSAAAIVAADATRTLFADELGNISRFSQMSSRLGPQTPVEEVKRILVDNASVAFGTDLVALYTIDPCLGSVECETTSGVSAELQAAFLDLYGDIVADPDRREASVQIGIPTQDVSNEAARRVFVDSGIDSLIACPVRSEAGVSGALVSFYPADVWCPDERRIAMEVVAELVSAALSHAAAMEQSGNLLDDLAGANQKLSLQATIDGLTGLANYRTLQQTLTDMCKSSPSRKSRVFSFVMMDADHFKIYNDTHGHREGDAALREIAKLVSSELRQGDLAARYGGEEFAIILKGVGKDIALGIAERIRRRAADHEMHKGSLTISMGIAEFPADAGTPAELIERADRAMYHSKVTGRNRVVIWGSAGCSAVSSTAAEDGKGPKRNILVVTPEDVTREMMCQTLTTASYAVESASSSEEAAEVLRARSFDLAMISLEALPGSDIKSLGLIASIHPDMPLVLIMAEAPLEFSRAVLRQGASDILLTPYVPAELPLVIERNVERRRMERQRLTEKSTSIMLQAIEALVAAIDAKDHYTAGHSPRVTSLALAISDDLSISNDDRYALELAAKIHDIGKVALPDSALNKQSPLNEEEWQAMREHPAIGCKIVGAIDELAYVSAIIRHHHERLDGTGYPDGLRGDAIPYLSRVIAVADAYEAMTSDRAYRGRLTPTEAIEELRSRAGAYYAPEIVEILDRKLRESGEIGDAEQTEAA